MLKLIEIVFFCLFFFYTITFGLSLFRHFWDTTFKLSKLLCLAKYHWWGFSTRNAHMVNIVNSIDLKWCIHLSWSLFLHYNMHMQKLTLLSIIIYLKKIFLCYFIVDFNIVHGFAKIRWPFHFKWCYINVILYSNNKLWWYILHCRDQKKNFPVIYNIIMLHVFIYVNLTKKVTKMAFFDCYAVALHFLQIRICDYSFYFNNVSNIDILHY